MFQKKLRLTIPIRTYGNVSMGAASIQSALDTLNDFDKQHFLNNVEQWNCGMEIKCLIN